MYLSGLSPATEELHGTGRERAPSALKEKACQSGVVRTESQPKNL